MTRAAPARLAVLGATLALACQREDRPLRHPATGIADAPTTALVAGSEQPRSDGRQPGGEYEESAYAVAQGKLLYGAFNCVGCHAHGGGGMGPPLMDEVWRYGDLPAQVFASIVEGRANGMPSFGGRLTDERVWWLVAYVRSLSRQVRHDALPGRYDEMRTIDPNP